MNMRIRFLAALLLFISTAGAALAAPERDSLSPVLKELIAAALADNPDLKAASARLHLYENKIVPAGSLNDPSLDLSLSNYPVDTLTGNECAMSGKVVRLSQDFPFPGKLAARTEIAELQAKWYQALLADQRLQLIRQVKEAYYNLVYAGRAVAITEKNMKLLDDFIHLTESNSAVGKGLQQEGHKAQAERTKLLDHLYALRQQRLTALAALNRLVSRPSTTEVAAVEESVPAVIDISLAELQKNSETRRPMYAAYRSVIDRYQAQHKLAELDYQPDFKLGLSYSFREPNRVDSGIDFNGVEVGLNLPIFWDRRKATVGEADEGVRVALAQYNDFRNQVLFNIKNAYSQVQTSHEQAVLYKKGILPQAGQALDAAIKGHQEGKLPFLRLLDNLMTLYNSELQYEKVVSDGQRSLARLEAEAGLSANPAEMSAGWMP